MFILQTWSRKVDLTVTRPSFISSFESLRDGEVISFCYADGLVELRSSTSLEVLVSIGSSFPPFPIADSAPLMKSEKDKEREREKAVPTLTIAASPNEAMFVVVDWFGKMKFYSLLDHLMGTTDGESLSSQLWSQLQQNCFYIIFIRIRARFGALNTPDKLTALKNGLVGSRIFHQQAC